VWRGEYRCGSIISIYPFHYPLQVEEAKWKEGFSHEYALFSGFSIGHLLLFLNARGVDIVFLAANVGFALFLLLYAIPVIIFAFLLPLWDIHTKMVSKGEAEENIYLARIQALRQEIQALLDMNQNEEAKAMQEKKHWWKHCILLTRHGLFVFARNLLDAAGSDREPANWSDRGSVTAVHLNAPLPLAVMLVVSWVRIMLVVS